MMGFLAALHFQYDSVKAHILSSLEISSFQETFNRILCIEISLLALPFAQMSSALVGQNISESGKPQYNNSDPCSNLRGHSFGVVCYYCRKPGHVMRDCKKLQNRNKRFPFAHVAFSNETFD